MLVYIANWARRENDPEAIVECDAYVDEEDGNKNLVLHLKRRRYEGEPYQHMSIQLDPSQVEQLLRMALEADLINMPIAQ